ncbi:T9SS type A sorting domain-containing protein [Xanthomarina sp. GH4-25]|uniref:T9SS type A sorting domain-containing protein n=1 Tax=Xanthomarina sp. GH4-25 TaxID=3349335 RepID=UPI003877AFC3
MLKNYFVIFFSLFFYSSTFAQENILCPTLELIVFFDDLDNIPTASENGDGTFTLTFTQPYITDIFSNYTIYNFVKTYPGNSSNALRTFTIFHNSNNLNDDLLTDVPESILRIIYSENYVSSLPTNTPIDTNIITALEGKTFDLIKYVNTSDIDICTYTYDCPLIDVPEDFELQVSFNYDMSSDIIYAVSNNPSSCGNTFSIGLKGGYPGSSYPLNNTLNLWEVTDWTATPSEYTQPCYQVENTLFSILGISCDNFYNYDNIRVEIDSETNNIRFSRVNAFFGYDAIEFTEANLISVEEHKLAQIKIFEKEGNPYLQVSKLDNKQYQVELISISGQVIKKQKFFVNNTLKIDALSSGLYFLNITSTDTNATRVIKFVKR